MPLHARAQVHTAGPNKLLLLVLCYRCCCCRCRSCCCYWSYSCNCCSIIVIYWCVVQFLILDSGTRLLTAHLWSNQLIGWPRASQSQASRTLDYSWLSIQLMLWTFLSTLTLTLTLSLPVFIMLDHHATKGTQDLNIYFLSMLVLSLILACHCPIRCPKYLWYWHSSWVWS